MDIQTFGNDGNLGVEKTGRYFKKRRIPVQRVDLFEEGLNKGEFRAVCRVLGNVRVLVDTTAKAKETVIRFQHMTGEDREAFLLGHSEILGRPIM